MAKLQLSDISDLRAYEREREQFREKVIAEKRLRRVALGPIITVVFENALTMRFQIQEMARAEKMATDELIHSELDAYNVLIPEPGELSMTLFIELTSEEQLHEWLPMLVGIERSVGLAIADEAPIRCEVDEDHAAQLTRKDVTASVHYLRIRLSLSQREAFATGPASLLIDHPAYVHQSELSDLTRASLAADWSE